MTSEHAPINERFESLDAYLAYLRDRNAPIDKPWYQEIRPGVYVLRAGGTLQVVGGNPPEPVFTREELERKFGFRK